MIASEAPVARTKGVSFVHTRAFALQRFGPDGWSAVLARLRVEERSEIEGAVSVGWYSLPMYAQMIRAVDEVHGTGDLALLIQLGRFQAERDFSTVQRLFFRLASPAFAIDPRRAGAGADERMADYWRRFHDSGTWQVIRSAEGEVYGALEAWGVVDRALCRELTGYMGRVLELVGARHVVMEHTRCRGLGDARCEYRARWAATRAKPVAKSSGPPSVPPPRVSSGVMNTLVSTPDAAAGDADAP